MPVIDSSFWVSQEFALCNYCSYCAPCCVCSDAVFQAPPSSLWEQCVGTRRAVGEILSSARSSLKLAGQKQTYFFVRLF